MGSGRIPDDRLFQLRLTSKHLAKQAKRCERERERYLAKLKSALKSGQADLTMVCAESAVRKTRERTMYLRLSARLDAVVTRLHSANEMGKVGTLFQGVAADVQGALRSLDVDRIDATLTRLEGHLDELHVRDGLLSTGMDRIGVMPNAPMNDEDEVTALIRQTADENNLELSEELQGVPQLRWLKQEKSRKEAERQAHEEEDELHARLRALQLP